MEIGRAVGAIGFCEVPVPIADVPHQAIGRLRIPGEPSAAVRYLRQTVRRPHDAASVADGGKHAGAEDTVCVSFRIHLNSGLLKFIKSCIR